MFDTLIYFWAIPSIIVVVLIGVILYFDEFPFSAFTRKELLVLAGIVLAWPLGAIMLIMTAFDWLRKKYKF